MIDWTTPPRREPPPRTELPVAAPGDIVRLLGLRTEGTYARVIERVSRGLVVDFTGVLMLVTGSERRDDPRVFDCESIEPWQLPTKRAPRRPRREAQS